MLPVQDGRQWQAGADAWLGGRPAHGHAGDREYQPRQFQQFDHRLRVIAEAADVADTEAQRFGGQGGGLGGDGRVHRGDQEVLDISGDLGVAAQLADAIQAA